MTTQTLLEEITISGLGVIDSATVALGPGLTVLTGETGAGKTMVVTSLGLLCGGKADATRVRAGATQAMVQGRVRLAPDSPLRHEVAQAGVDLEDDQELLLARSVAATGRSRAYAGSRSMPAGWLAQLAQDLIAVHGQSDQQRLLRPAQQRAALDRYAGPAVAALLEDYRQVWQQLNADTQQLEQLTAHARQRAQEADLLRDGLARIEAVNPQPDEIERLQAQADRLAHAEDLHTATSTAHALLVGGDDLGAGPGSSTDVSTLLTQVAKLLTNASIHDSALAGLAQRVEQAGYQMADVAAELASYAAGVETDPARLDAIGARQQELAGLLRRYADTLPEVLQWAATASSRLAQLDQDDTSIASLQQRVDQGVARRQELAAALSAARGEAAQRMAAEVSAELAHLALPHAHLHVTVEPTQPGPSGADEVSLLLQPHPGSPALPLQQGASGGELSRVMLALEVVLAGRDPVPVFVFDEVDAGVGGKAALEVGRRLARLARHAQVLVVTHLPQVACYADAHLSVVKSSDGCVVSSGVVVLDRPAREAEIARMLAGAGDSATARAHAAELLDAAAAQLRAGGWVAWGGV